MDPALLTEQVRGLKAHGTTTKENEANWIPSHAPAPGRSRRHRLRPSRAEGIGYGTRNQVDGMRAAAKGDVREAWNHWVDRRNLVSARAALRTATAHRYTDMLHERVVAIAINHASGAAVAHALRSVELSDVAKRPVPVVAAPDL